MRWLKHSQERESGLRDTKTDEGPAEHFWVLGIGFARILCRDMTSLDFRIKNPLAHIPQDGSLLTEEPWEGKESDRIDFGKFIPKDVRRTGHDIAMTPEDVYCAPYYRSNVEWSLVEEDSAQAGFARVLPMEDPDPIFDEGYEPTGQPGRPPLRQGRGRGGMRGGRRWSRPMKGQAFGRWCRPLGGEASGKIGPVPPLDLESDTESEPKKGMEGEAAVLLDLDFEDAFAQFLEPEKPGKHQAGNMEFAVLPITGDGACLYRALLLGTQLRSGVPRGRLQAWCQEISGWIRKHTLLHYITVTGPYARRARTQGGCL